MGNTLIIGINLGDRGSTGSIMRSSLEYAAENGNFDYLVIVPKEEGKPNSFGYLKCKNSIVDKLDRHFFHRSINNPDGFYERRTTLRIIKRIKNELTSYSKVFVHLHNIHMARIDLRYLFNFFAKEKKIYRVFYTLHDCWSFTGGCYFFERHKCEKWMNGCRGSCVQDFGHCLFSTAKSLRLKDKYTHLIRDKLILLPVSKWCDNLLKKSILKDIPSIVIEGECDIKPVGFQDLALRNILNLKDGEKVLMMVDGWKGFEYLDQFIDKIPENYKLILINGKKSYESNNVIQFDRIHNSLLPLFFSITDCYVSLTQEDNLPLTLMEAQICGVPIAGFGQNGTSEEIVDGVSGIMVGKDNNVDKLIDAIKFIIEKSPFKKEDIIASGMRFSKMSAAKKYFNLYNKFN